MTHLQMFADVNIHICSSRDILTCSFLGGCWRLMQLPSLPHIADRDTRISISITTVIQRGRTEWSNDRTQLEEEGKEQRRNSDQMGERGAGAPIMTGSYRVIKLLFHILLMPLPTREQQSNKHTLCFQPFSCPFYALARSRAGGYYPVGRQANNCLMQPSPQQNPWKWFKNMGWLGFFVILRLCFMWGHVPLPCPTTAAGALPPLPRWLVLPKLWDQARAEPFE